MPPPCFGGPENVVLSHKTAPKLLHINDFGCKISASFLTNIKHTFTHIHPSIHLSIPRVSSAIKLEFRCQYLYFTQKCHSHERFCQPFVGNDKTEFNAHCVIRRNLLIEFNRNIVSGCTHSKSTVISIGKDQQKRAQP